MSGRRTNGARTKARRASASEGGPAVPAALPLFPTVTAHRTDLGRLEHGCGVSWLEACAPGTVDLVVADPPYAIGKSKERPVAVAD